jgi:hypothetical protein
MRDLYRIVRNAFRSLILSSLYALALAFRILTNRLVQPKAILRAICYFDRYSD